MVGAETPEPDPEPVPPPVLGGAPDFVGGAPDCPPVGLGFFPVRETGWGAGWVAAAAGAATVAPEAGAARVGAAPPCRATCVLECRPAVWGAVTTIFVDGCDSNPGTAARGNRGPPESTRRASAAAPSTIGSAPTATPETTFPVPRPLAANGLFPLPGVNLPQASIEGYHKDPTTESLV